MANLNADGYLCSLLVITLYKYMYMYDLDADSFHEKVVLPSSEELNFVKLLKLSGALITKLTLSPPTVLAFGATP